MRYGVRLLSMTVLFSLSLTCRHSDSSKLAENDDVNSKPDLMYMDLEEDTEQRDTWIRDQNGKALKFYQNEKARACFEELFRGSMNTTGAFKSLPLNGSWRIDGVDEGLGKAMVVNLVSSDGTNSTIFSTFEANQNHIDFIQDISISPSKEWLIVTTGSRGTTDIYDLHIFEIQYHESIEIFPREKISGASLMSSQVPFIGVNTIAYNRKNGADFETFVHKLGTDPTMDVRDGYFKYVSNILDQKWVLAGVYSSEKQYRFKKISESEWREWPNTLPFRGIIGESPGKFWRIARGEESVGEERIESYDIESGERIKLIQEADGRILTPSITEEYLWYMRRVEGIYKLVVFSTNGELLLNVPLPSGIKVGMVDIEASSIKIGLISTMRKAEKVEVPESGDINEMISSKAKDMMIMDGVAYHDEIVNVPSHDGKEIPVRIIAKGGLSNFAPALIDVYGGFDINHIDRQVLRLGEIEFVRNGGVMVFAGVRGGGELDTAWHRGGYQENKKNTFFDVISVAEYLIAHKITSSSKLALTGWSNGGLTTAATVVMRPDLFRLAIPGAGVVDMMRTSVLDSAFEGWSSEYGDINESQEQKAYMKSYSPIHNAVPNKYPTFLIIAGRNDSRVNPAHSYKLAQALQDNQLGDSPILLAATKNGGHWQASEQIQGYIAWYTNSLLWSTIFTELGMSFGECN